MTARLAGNRRLALLALAAAVAFLAVVLLARSGGGGGDPPASEAARLVPAETLVFASLSTDGGRDAVDQARDLAARFDSYDRARDALLRRLAGDDRPVDPQRDVAPWLGGEAALALMDTGTATAGSLVAIAVTDEEKARELLERNPRDPVRKDYKGRETVRYGQVTTAFLEGFLLIGQDPTVQRAIDRVVSRAKALEGDPVYERAVAGLPDDRVLTAYASADGLRRLLVPQGDVLGGLAAMLDQPALQGVALAAEPEGDDRLRIRVHSALDRERQERSPSPFEQFEPALLDAVPRDALAYLGASGISGALQRLVVSSIGGARGDEVTQLLERLRTELDRETGGGLQRDLLKLLEGEVALVIQRQTPVPILSLVTRTDDEAGTRRTLDGLRAPLARLLRPEGEEELRWQARDVAGTDAWTLTLPNGAAITYGVTDGRLIVSTSPDGIARIARGGDSLEDSEAFQEVLGERPDRVGTLGFLDFSQLLELGEQTGLNDSRAYAAVRDDLRRIRAIGVSSSSDEGESTAEILVSIP
ncbi:MAG TPA: DUF3352 domain-containing protein [Solirubrobacteraceae bacterium]|nr:DUF3352 domain-containing protein [Solirubrobacteraceae bacterium]